MQVLQMIAGQGGCHQNIFSPDDLVPLYGGTYFPVEARYDALILHCYKRFAATTTQKTGFAITEAL